MKHPKNMPEHETFNQLRDLEQTSYIRICYDRSCPADDEFNLPHARAEVVAQWYSIPLTIRWSRVPGLFFFLSFQ